MFMALVKIKEQRVPPHIQEYQQGQQEHIQTFLMGDTRI